MEMDQRTSSLPRSSVISCLYYQRHHLAEAMDVSVTPWGTQQSSCKGGQLIQGRRFDNDPQLKILNKTCQGCCETQAFCLLALFLTSTVFRTIFLTVRHSLQVYITTPTNKLMSQKETDLTIFFIPLVIKSRFWHRCLALSGIVKMWSRITSRISLWKTTAIYLPAKHCVGSSPSSGKEILAKEQHFYPLNTTNLTCSKYIYLDKAAFILYVKED